MAKRTRKLRWPDWAVEPDPADPIHLADPSVQVLGIFALRGKSPLVLLVERRRKRYRLEIRRLEDLQVVYEKHARILICDPGF